MRTILLSLIVFTLASSQELEAVIYVSDTMRGAASPTAMAFDSVRNVLYVAGTNSDYVVAVDGTTGAKVAHFPLGATFTVSALCYRPATSKLYCFSAWSAETRVLDVTGGAQVKVVALSAPATVLMYNPATNRLYCASPSSSTADVVDCGTDSVRATIPLAGGVNAMCRSRLHGKLYFLSRSYRTITVVDEATDSILSVIPVSQYPFSLCSDEQGERIYCGAIDKKGLYVVDAAGDSVVALVPGGRALVGLCYSPTSNRLYCADSSRDRIYIFDPSSLTFLDSLKVGNEPWYVYWSPTLNRVYAVTRDDRSVSVLDCARDSIVATVDVNLRASGITGNAGGTMLYYLSTRSNGLALIDSLNVLSAAVRFGVGPRSITGNRSGTEVYVGVTYSDSLYVVDCATNTYWSRWFSQLGTTFLLYSPGQDKLYGAGGYDYVTILDAGPDTLLKQWPYGGYATAVCSNPRYDKVYVGGDVLAIYDGPTNGVLAEITLESGEVASLACDARTGKVYLSNDNEEYLLVLDGLRNTIIDTVFNVRYDDVASAVDTGARRVYFATYLNGDFVSVVDADRDSLVREVELGAGQATQLACDQVRHRLYCGGEADTVAVLDCLGDSVAARVSVNPFETMLCDDRAGRLYTMGYDDTLRMLDGGTLGTLGRVAVGGGTHYMFLNTVRDRLYVTSTNTSAVYVIRCGVGVAEPVADGFATSRTTQSVFRGPVFSLSAEPEDVLDASGRRVAVLAAGKPVSLPAGVYFLVTRNTGAGRRIVVVR
jgi:DNA-binding beta-propeller fold protein YncE